jgi:hypothetical protein
MQPGNKGIGQDTCVYKWHPTPSSSEDKGAFYRQEHYSVRDEATVTKRHPEEQRLSLCSCSPLHHQVFALLSTWVMLLGERSESIL